MVETKYRGTIAYFKIFSELIQAARYRGTVTYQEIAKILGLPLTGNYMGTEIGHLLGEISEDEISQGRPMLSSVVVNHSGKPGPGFFGMARDLGKLASDHPEEEIRFWGKELRAVYAAWKIRLE